jgi:opacity protein-like surface antigen
MLAEMKMPVPAALLLLLFVAGIFLAPPAAVAEWYVAGDAGVNFADRLSSVEGTNAFSGIQFEDLDLQNSVSVGGKLGYFPQHSWVGVEGEVLYTTPHIKGLENDPGIHLRVTTVGVNLLVRYPGRTFQPYAGFGVGAVIAHIGDSGGVQSDTDVATGWNGLVGLRAFITPRVALFTEYKYTAATLQFNEAFGPSGGFEGTYRAQHVLAGLSYHF